MVFCHSIIESMTHLYKSIFNIIILIIIFCNVTGKKAFAGELKNIPIAEQTIVIYTPHIFNPKFFSFEVGFITKKKIKSINYPFNAFAKILIAEEFFSTSSNLRAGAIGIKTGVLLPTQPWLPLLFEVSIGYGKTSLHEDPWLGDRDKSIDDAELFLIEAGAIYRISSSLFFRAMYQLNTLNYLKRQTFFSVGFNF
jgi:hypothetical protein